MFYGFFSFWHISYLLKTNIEIPILLNPAFMLRRLPPEGASGVPGAGIVEDRVTGLHFTPGDPADLASKVRWPAALDG